MEEIRVQKEGSRPEQEPIPKKSEGPVSAWAQSSRDLINQIDHDPQLEETEPGTRFSQDLVQLLDPEITGSRTEFSQLLDSLYEDVESHDFMNALNEKGEEYIHMAHETGPMDLGNRFKNFSRQLGQFPVPSFDKELAEKRDRLARAFRERGQQLAGE